MVLLQVVLGLRVPFEGLPELAGPRARRGVEPHRQVVHLGDHEALALVAALQVGHARRVAGIGVHVLERPDDVVGGQRVPVGPPGALADLHLHGGAVVQPRVVLGVLGLEPRDRAAHGDVLFQRHRDLEQARHLTLREEGAVAPLMLRDQPHGARVLADFLFHLPDERVRRYAFFDRWQVTGSDLRGKHGRLLEAHVREHDRDPDQQQGCDDGGEDDSL